MRQLLVVVMTALAGCAAPDAVQAPKSDAVFLSRKPVDGLAECITWGWGNQKFDDVASQYTSAPIKNGLRLAADAGAELLDIVDISGKTELNLFLAGGTAHPRVPKRVAVIEACL